MFASFKNFQHVEEHLCRIRDLASRHARNEGKIIGADAYGGGIPSIGESEGIPTVVDHQDGSLFIQHADMSR